MKKLIMTAALAAVACGCTTVKQNDGGESDLRVKVCKDIVHEKLSVENQKVSAKDQLHCVLGLISWGSSATHISALTDDIAPTPTARVKNGAYANACDAAKCDQIVATRYKVTKKDYVVYAKYDAEITGYPAKVTGVEVLTPPCVKKANGCCPKACPKAK